MTIHTGNVVGKRGFSAIHEACGTRTRCIATERDTGPGNAGGGLFAGFGVAKDLGLLNKELLRRRGGLPFAHDRGGKEAEHAHEVGVLIVQRHVCDQHGLWERIIHKMGLNFFFQDGFETCFAPSTHPAPARSREAEAER